MARQPKPKAKPPLDDNDPGSKSLIAEQTAEIIKLEARRASINADIASARAKIKATNTDMDAWKAAKRRAEMDPDVRSEFDRSARLCNEALGVPIQADLFADPEGDGDGDDSGNDDGTNRPIPMFN